MRTFPALILTLYFTYVFSETTKVPNKTTTATKVSTITTPVTTATPAPHVPVYSNSTYNVYNASGICLMLHTDLVLRIPYFNQKGEPLIKEFFLNGTTVKNVDVSGDCTPEYQFVSLAWAPTTNPETTFSTNLNFTLQKTDGVFGLSAISLNFAMTSALFPDTNDTARYSVSNVKSQFTCPVGYFYQCKSAQTFELTTSVGQKPLVMYELFNMKVEAFRKSPNNTFVGKLRQCTADSAANRIVPIVVGVALAVMIIVAIITFIIGSRRRRIGYQSI